MRCLIPVHQEYYPKNALKRAEKLCEEVTLLYIVDKRVIEKVQVDSSYILPSYSIESIKEFVINIHREEAKKIKKSMKKVAVELKFVVGEYYESIDKEVIKNAPELVMCDSYIRRFLNLDVPVWIDNGANIKECTIILQSLKKINKVKHSVNFARRICECLGINFYIHYPPRDEGGLKALNPLGKIINSPKGELQVFLKDNTLNPSSDICLLLI